MIEIRGIALHLGRRATVDDVDAFDDVVLATGVTPRVPPIPGIEHPSVVTYQQVVGAGAPVGARVAVIGAGGIGFDVAEFLLHEPGESTGHWMRRWGVTDPGEQRGGLTTKVQAPPRREVHLLQRKNTALGKGLGRTSGWVHRQTLKDSGVRMLGGVEYVRVDDDGLHITVPVNPKDPKSPREARLLAVDTVVVCAGQEPVRDLVVPLTARGAGVHVIGGADVAAELDAKRAIRQATELAAHL